MAYYSDLCVQSEHLLADPYQTDYSQQYLIPNQEAEYEVRSTVLVDGGDRFGVASVVFDKYEELIWMGNQGGHVTSYYGPAMQKYTSFQVHESEEVRDILTVENGIFALTKTSLRHQIRRGIPKHTHKSKSMSDMQCLYQVSSHKLLMGGHQDKLIDLDLNKMVENIIKIPEEGSAVLRSGGGSLVACGSANGMVSLRDIRCPGKAEHSFRAHSACLSDLDMQGDTLISCGFTQSGGVAVAEPYLLVWDVRGAGRRRAPSVWSLPLGWPPLLLHFVPAVSGRAVALGGDGNVALLHVNESHNVDHSVFQVDTHSAHCSAMDVSSTSQALVFGDQAGHLHLFSAQHNHEPRFNNFSRGTEFADPDPGLPFVSLNDTGFKYSSVPLPPLASGSKWLNEMPEAFYKRVYRKPKTIDPEVLKSMKMQGPIGYAPNPKNTRRNQIPYVNDTLEDLQAVRHNDFVPNIQPIPKCYLKMDFRLYKHGVDDLEINKTGLPGLEATLPNSYCNSMLQVLYYIPQLKTTLLAHTCAKEFCLSCELGFLFRTLDASGGSPCQASNFLRAFRTVPEAAALGLILDRGDQKADLVTLIQSWNRFILHQIHYEILETRKKEKELAFLTQNSSPPKPSRISSRINRQVVNGQYVEDYQYTELEFLGPSEYEEFREPLEDSWKSNNNDEEHNHVRSESIDVSNNHNNTDREDSEISQLFAIVRQQLNRCLKCNKEEERMSVALACALQYGGGERGFADLLRAALAARRSTPAWCERCARFTPTTQRARPHRLPPILAINCGGTTAQEKAYWSKSVTKDATEALKRGLTGKPCRYGLHCARPGCRFKHPDRGLSQSASPDSCTLPHRLHVRLQADGDVLIDDKTDPPPVDKRAVWSDSYALTAVIACVEDGPRHLVAYVSRRKQWFLFNDLSIMPVSAEEVVQFSWWWKSPCVLFYTSVGAAPPS
ncbi:PAN2-PAN3 deadenylation complex catalytic subunit PAN2 [Aricia agestis]|uniref:PAN2-PAN3 deadenylation complex catalytic subunit PAN2 n=1 Tax=Aricia agestis TaxID=91739 RepID=UPI001C2073F2|nr:PAN2-PAN3 deadenylation complex catalytic subunit PAN2 [Aricia agestis]